MKFSKLAIASVFLLACSAFGMAQTATDTPRSTPSALVSEMTEEGWRLPFGHPDPSPWRLIRDGYSQDDAVAAQKRLAAIIAEQSEGKSLPVAPMYRAWYDTREVRMWVAPNAEYVFVYLHNCAHGVQALSYGDVRISDGTIELIPSGGNSFSGEPNQEGFDPLAVIGKKIARARFQGSEVLVPENRLKEFAAGVSGRRVSEYGIESFSPFMYGMNRGGERIRESGGYLTLPPEYSQFFLAPIRGQVASVGQPVFQPEREEEVAGENGEKEKQVMAERFVITVTCEVDLPDGLLPGMWLRLCQPGLSRSVLKVIKVTDKTVVCEFDAFPDDEPEGWADKTVKEKLEWLKRLQPLKPGFSVSTSEFDVPEADEASAGDSDPK